MCLESVENEDIIKIFMAKKSRRLELECTSGCNMFLFTFCSITKIVLKTILHMKHHATVQIECERYKSRRAAVVPFTLDLNRGVMLHIKHENW